MRMVISISQDFTDSHEITCKKVFLHSLGHQGGYCRLTLWISWLLPLGSLPDLAWGHQLVSHLNHLLCFLSVLICLVNRMFAGTPIRLHIPEDKDCAFSHGPEGSSVNTSGSCMGGHSPPGPCSNYIFHIPHIIQDHPMVTQGRPTRRVRAGTL